MPPITLVPGGYLGTVPLRGSADAEMAALGGSGAEGLGNVPPVFWGASSGVAAGLGALGFRVWLILRAPPSSSSGGEPLTPEGGWSPGGWGRLVGASPGVC